MTCPSAGLPETAGHAGAESLERRIFVNTPDASILNRPELAAEVTVVPVIGSVPVMVLVVKAIVLAPLMATAPKALPQLRPAPRLPIAPVGERWRATVRSVPLLSLKSAEVPLVVGTPPAEVFSEAEYTTRPALFMSALSPVLTVRYATPSVAAPAAGLPAASGKAELRRAMISL
jgi:hypothetical protein